ncbi:hypothetical protein [Kribbella deserti]|uniref:Uncharacterized protein n=1 Tax=Kribbella deserti TaxID=1926257 RepID=A0ABV6QL61_9ACTN
MRRRIEQPRFVAALREVNESLEAAWREFRATAGVEAGGPDDERELARVVLQDPSEFDWRVVDAALTKLSCDGCGNGLGAGPVGCHPCDQANGFRFAARETDRPAVPPGNEHAIRVSSAVARTRDRYSPRARCGYEVFLPDLLAGELPTTPEAQALKAIINTRTDDQLESVTTYEELIRR